MLLHNPHSLSDTYLEVQFPVQGFSASSPFSRSPLGLQLILLNRHFVLFFHFSGQCCLQYSAKSACCPSKLGSSGQGAHVSWADSQDWSLCLGWGLLVGFLGSVLGHSPPACYNS